MKTAVSSGEPQRSALLDRLTVFAIRVLKADDLPKALLVLAACALPLLSGCATPIHDTDRFSANTGVQTLSVDAKQRVVLFSKRPDPDPTVAAELAKAAAASHSKDRGLITVTCAEPSPDALSALSTSVGGSVTDPKVALNLAIAASESAASIGLRTQSIQILRDGMYRLCEAYAGRAIDGPEYNRQLRRFQNLMLGLLAVEQITGAVVARQATLGDGSAGASGGENADKAATDATAGASAVDDAQKALTQAHATQTTDENTCKAAAPDTTNPACGKATSDASDVSTKQAALDTAKKKAVTANMVLQAARGAVMASAAGAHVTLSDQTKTNSISDSSARYIAEATRTIVSTTLIASFAQEECSRLWDFVAAAPKDVQSLLLLGASNLSLDGGARTEGEIRPQSEAQKQAAEAGVPLAVLAGNCSKSQESLLSRAAFFTPDYGSPPPPLEVLGADAAIPMAIGGPPVDLRIVGGTPPFEAIVPSNFKLEIDATMPPAKGAIRSVHITRPAGASKTGAASIIVIDASNVHVEIPIMLTAKAEEKPAAIPPPTGVTASATGGGKITVKFTPPKTGQIKGFTAIATSTDAAKKVLKADAGPTATSVDIDNCTAGTSYSVTIETVPMTGTNSSKAKAAGPPPTCGAAAPTAGKSPGPPTGVVTKPLAGGKFEVAFKAPADDGQGAVTQYTVKASDLTDTKQKVPEVSGAVSPITVTGCKAKDEFAIMVIATRGGKSSDPAVETAHPKCLP